MFKNHQLHAALLLTIGLSACTMTTGSRSKFVEHHYAFGRPAANASGVAPVEVKPQRARSGPDNVAHIVYFDFDSYTVRASDRGIIESHAQWMRSHPEQSLMLPGHTDARGGTEYNLALGQKRAESVRKSLQILGVDPSRVEAVSYGKERLADQGTSEAAHQRNRRVEFEYR